MNTIALAILNEENKAIDQKITERFQQDVNPAKNVGFENSTEMEVFCHIGEKVNILKQQKEFIEGITDDVSRSKKELSTVDLAQFMMKYFNSTDSFGVLGYKKQALVRILRRCVEIETVTSAT
jgi:hypothetical protein